MKDNTQAGQHSSYTTLMLYNTQAIHDINLWLKLVNLLIELIRLIITVYHNINTCYVCLPHITSASYSYIDISTQRQLVSRNPVRRNADIYL